MKLKLLALSSLVLLFACNNLQGADSKQSTAPSTASKEDLKKLLTPEQYNCTQENGTEAPFHNAYWNNHDDGIYVDLVSHEALFSSLDKYDSGTGWPSFTKPIADNLKYNPDHDLGVERTELRSKKGNSHLGHVFDDGPADKGGKRYCINSASMSFIPLKEMKDKGYGAYLFLFAQKEGWGVATLAGGCFWGMEEILRKQAGVIETQVGFSGGNGKQVSYEEVSTGTTGYAESVQILFDPKVTSYEKLLVLFFKMHDPTTLNKQENDVGTQYRSAIFYDGAEQEKTAKAVKARAEKSGLWKAPIVTQVLPFTGFVRADEYHQKYLEKNPHGYFCHYIRKIDFK